MVSYRIRQTQQQQQQRIPFLHPLAEFVRVHPVEGDVPVEVLVLDCHARPCGEIECEISSDLAKDRCSTDTSHEPTHFAIPSALAAAIFNYHTCFQVHIFRPCVQLAQGVVLVKPRLVQPPRAVGTRAHLYRKLGCNVGVQGCGGGLYRFFRGT